jgi:transposase
MRSRSGRGVGWQHCQDDDDATSHYAGVVVTGFTDTQGLDGLAMLVQEKLRQDPFGGQIFVFRGDAAICSRRCGGTARVAAPVREAVGEGSVVWPSSAHGRVMLTRRPLAALGIDWRMPARTWRPQAAG